MKRKIESVMESASIIRERRGRTYDLRPLVEGLQLLPGCKIFMKLAAREGATGRPEEVLNILGFSFENTKIERTRLIFNVPQAMS